MCVECLFEDQLQTHGGYDAVELDLLSTKSCKGFREDESEGPRVERGA